MTTQDHAALAAIGRHMAATNGYTPEQASDLYISSGTTRDYQYGVYRIFAYTFEMSVKDYPDDSMIAPETGRNKEVGPVPDGTRRVSAGRPRRGRAHRPLRRVRRRPRGHPRLDREPGRHRHGAGQRAVRPREPGRRRRAHGPKQLGTVRVGRARRS